ncbi:putative inositol monophosphatase 3 [Periplaneta americana]|uniref:putative inositol monophosphatase 3 n=1 Tax=Periplaneta americana TaxID=6978 RepID=UPI0037E8330F
MNFGGTIRLNRMGICIIIGACVLLVLYINASGIESPKIEPVKNSDTVSMRSILVAAIKVAEEGGKEIVKVRKEPDIGEKIQGKTEEGVNDPVTRADYNSHCVMYYNLKRSFPKAKIISEHTRKESDCTNLSKLGDGVELNPNPPDQLVPSEDVTIWIDPLDATKEFTENLLQYVTTMVCVAVKGEPIIGVIHKPFETEPQTFWAWSGNSHSNNLKHKDGTATGTRIIVSISHAGSVKNISEQAFGKDVEVTAGAGAGYKSLMVASGEQDAYIHTTAIKKWDICAGNAIINSLGGRMTTLTNETIDYSSSDAVNKKGLLATVKNHQWYLDKLKMYV